MGIGIPEAAESDDTDAAILSICAAIKVDPPVRPVDIAVSHQVGKTVAGKPRQILVKFATRNIRERVFQAKKIIKTEREENESLKISILMKTWLSTGPIWPERLASTKQIIPF